MRTVQPPPGDRFFARLLAVLLECPACGFLDSFQWRKLSLREVNRRRRKAVHTKGTRKTERQLDRHGWDAARGTWRCPQCARAFVLGLLAWPAPPRGEATRPRDQVPTERELTQLRAQRLEGLWLPDAMRQVGRRHEHSNITAACTCKRGTAYTNQRDRGCPIHGDDEGETEKGPNTPTGPPVKIG